MLQEKLNNVIITNISNVEKKLSNNEFTKTLTSN